MECFGAGSVYLSTLGRGWARSFCKTAVSAVLFLNRPVVFVGTSCGIFVFTTDGAHNIQWSAEGVDGLRYITHMDLLIGIRGSSITAWSLKQNGPVWKSALKDERLRFGFLLSAQEALIGGVSDLEGCRGEVLAWDAKTGRQLWRCEITSFSSVELWACSAQPLRALCVCEETVVAWDLRALGAQSLAEMETLRWLGLDAWDFVERAGLSLAEWVNMDGETFNRWLEVLRVRFVRIRCDAAKEPNRIGRILGDPEDATGGGCAMFRVGFGREWHLYFEDEFEAADVEARTAFRMWRKEQWAATRDRFLTAWRGCLPSAMSEKSDAIHRLRAVSAQVEFKSERLHEVIILEGSGRICVSTMKGKVMVLSADGVTIFWERVTGQRVSLLRESATLGLLCCCAEASPVSHPEVIALRAATGELVFRNRDGASHFVSNIHTGWSTVFVETGWHRIVEGIDGSAILVVDSQGRVLHRKTFHAPIKATTILQHVVLVGVGDATRNNSSEVVCWCGQSGADLWRACLRSRVTSLAHCGGKRTQSLTIIANLSTVHQIDDLQNACSPLAHVHHNTVRPKF